MSNYDRYKVSSIKDAFAIARAYPLALVCKNGVDFPETAHVPVIANPDLKSAEFHMARANEAFLPFAAGGNVKVVFSGPSAYISPAFYEARWEANDNDRSKTAPTFDYVDAEVRGSIQMLSSDELTTHLKKLVDHFESRRAWTFKEIDKNYLEKMKEHIAGFRIDIDHVSGISKLSQEQSPADRRHVVSSLRQRGLPFDAAMANIMEFDLDD